MRKFLKVILLFTFVFYFCSCEDNPSDNIHKGVINFNDDVKKCGVLGSNDIGHGIYIAAVSKDNKKMIAYFGSIQSPFILHLEENQSRAENFVFPKSNSKELEYSSGITSPIFCPYNKDIILFAHSIIKEKVDELGNKTYSTVPQWSLYNIQTNTLEKLQFLNKEIESLVYESHLSIVHWSSKSSLGNDIFYLGNFKKLHLQSEQLSESGFQKPVNDTSLRLVLVSPDETKYFSVINYTEFYLNSKLLNIGINLRDVQAPWAIHWSDDSKYFSTQVPINDYEPLKMVRSPAVYRINEDNSVTLEMSYNMLKKHCSNPNSFPGSPVFISDTSYLYCLYPKLAYFGDLYEFNKQGDVIRRITNFFD